MPLPRSEPLLSRWYGWQVLAADAASATLFTVGFLNNPEAEGKHDSGNVLLIASGGYFLAAPIIHLAHHRLGAAGGSLGLRLALPLMFGAIGMGEQTCPPSGEEDYGNCGFLGVAEGAAIGAMTAILFDATLNSVAPLAEAQDQERRLPPGLQLGLSPALSADGKRAELRLFGTF